MKNHFFISLILMGLGFQLKGAEQPAHNTSYSRSLWAIGGSLAATCVGLAYWKYRNKLKQDEAIIFRAREIRIQNNFEVSMSSAIRQATNEREIIVKASAMSDSDFTHKYFLAQPADIQALLYIHSFRGFSPIFSQDKRQCIETWKKSKDRQDKRVLEPIQRKKTE